MKLFNTFLKVLAPHDCLGCGAEGALICKKCATRLMPAIPRCYRCHVPTKSFRTCPSCKMQSDLYAVYPAAQYSGITKDIVWRLKFARTQSAAEEMARFMVALLPSPASRNPYYIIPVPTATSRVRLRGYDQASLLAGHLCNTRKIPRTNFLVRLGQFQQVGASRGIRQDQLRHAFRLVHASKVKGAHIILIDDVVTTGATLEAAARLLVAAGAQRVEAVVFAQA